MSNVTHMSLNVIALELVKIAKAQSNSIPEERSKDAATLYIEYHEKIKRCIEGE